MTYETKSIYKLLYNLVGKCESIEEALEMIADAANAEGVVIESKSKSQDKKAGD